MSITGFSFCGKHSSEFGIYAKVTNIPLLPQKRYVEENVLGRNGSYKFDDGYADKVISVQCYFVETDYKLRKQKAREVAKWLSGQGPLILDIEKDKYYSARLYEAIGIQNAIVLDEFPLNFVCEPIAYSTYVNEFVILDSQVVLYTPIKLDDILKNNYQVTKNMTAVLQNYGTYEVLPMIEIEGTAKNITFHFGNQKQYHMILNNITKKTWIDCENMICYTKAIDGRKENKLMDLEGQFLKLDTGENRVDIAGSQLNCNVFFNYKNAYL